MQTARTSNSTGSVKRWTTAGLAVLAMLFVPAIAAAQDGGTTTLKLDNDHSQVLARATHLGASFTFVEFPDVSGTVEFNQEDPSKSSIELEVKTKSLDSSVEKRDDHLTGADFFNVREYPKMTFKSKKVKKKDENTYEVTGDLTIKGNTNEVTIDVKHVGEGEDREGNTRHGFYTEFDINRVDYGIDWKKDAGVAGKTVHLIVAIEGVAK